MRYRVRAWTLAATALQIAAIALSAIAAPPAYKLMKQDGVWWLRDPNGRPFFSLGVCCVTPGDPFTEFNPANPGYAAWQNYPNVTAWANATVDRLKSWGFTTIGGWSDLNSLKKSPRMDMPYTIVLHMGSGAGAPWWDMWDPKIVATMDDIAKKQILPVKDDPRLLGYYSDNEMGWWNAPLLKMTLDEKPEAAQRRHLLTLLRTTYANDWKRLTRDFIVTNAAGFADLDRRGMLYLRPGSDGIKTIRKFVGMLATRYYSLCHDIIRKYDPSRGLILGDRYQSFYFPEVVRAAGPYVDVISTNLNPSWNDGEFARFYLDTLHSLSGRPVMIGEFYMCAMENGTGNKNHNSGFPVVETQAERAEGFRMTLASLIMKPYVVGADWFQFADEPPLGRGDGEDYNMGLVDVHDAPYGQLVRAAEWLPASRYHGRAFNPSRSPSVIAPPVLSDPFSNMKPMTALIGWERQEGRITPRSSDPNADLYACWDRDAVYLGLWAIDVVEADLYRDGHVPDVDRAELIIRVPASSNPIHVRLGAGRPAATTATGVRVEGISGLEHNARNIAVVRLPASLFRKRQIKPGDDLPLDVTFISNARGHRVDWQTTRSAYDGPIDTVAP